MGDDSQPPSKKLNIGESANTAFSSADGAEAGGGPLSESQSVTPPSTVSPSQSSESKGGRKGSAKGSKKEKKDTSYNRKEKSLGLLCEKSSHSALLTTAQQRHRILSRTRLSW